MILFVKIVFWFSLFILCYNYFIYPAIMWFINSLLPPRKARPVRNFKPSVTLIISAYNEAEVIDAKLQNATELDYPEALIQIIVVSDASTDETDKRVEAWSQKKPNIRLLRMPKRGGKTLGLNEAVRQATGEFVVFSDANALYEKNAIFELIKYFTDPEVGFVVGNAKYYRDKDNAATENEGLYWAYETYIKKLESDFHSVVVGDGAIYAIRKSLYETLDIGDIADFVNPIQIAARGYVGAFNENAVCSEKAAGDFKKEFSRKRRIVNRSWRGFKNNIGRFRLRKHGKFLFSLISHKLIRWYNWLFYSINLIAAGLWVFLEFKFFSALFFAAHLAFLSLAYLGYCAARKGQTLSSLLSFPYYYLIINLAALLGIWDDFRGVKYVTWEHVRESEKDQLVTTTRQHHG